MGKIAAEALSLPHTFSQPRLKLNPGPHPTTFPREGSRSIHKSRQTLGTKVLHLCTEKAISETRVPPCPSKPCRVPLARPSPSRKEEPKPFLPRLGLLGRMGKNQLFYFTAASGTSHSPCRVLGTFRLPYLCPIGLMSCRGVISEIHQKDQATFPSSPTQEEAAKGRFQQRAIPREGRISRRDFHPPFESFRRSPFTLVTRPLLP